MSSRTQTLIIALLVLALLLPGAILNVPIARASAPASTPAALPSGTLGVEFDRYLPGDEVVGAAATNQVEPDIARGGDISLVAWTDWRSTPSGYGSFYETGKDVYAMRLDANGTPLDPVAFPVSQNPGDEENPLVAWNGTHWLVVFESTGLNGTGGYYEKSLSAVRVAPDGTVVDANPIRIFNTLPTSTDWSVASNGDEWVVAFQGTAASLDLQAIRITADGELLQPATSLVPQTYYMRFHLRLAYASGVYLLTWSDYDDTKAIRFDENLNLLDPAPFVLLPAVNLRRLISNGSQFYIVWEEQQPDFSMAVMGSRLSTDGTKLDGDGDNISATFEPQPYTAIGVVWDGLLWRVNWSNNDALRMARVDADGQVLNPGGLIIPGPSSGVSAGTSLGGVHMVWETYTSWQNDIFSANITAQDTAGPNTALSTGGPMQIRADTAAGGNGYMVVYRSDTGENGRILAQPLDADGDPLLAEPVQLDLGSMGNTPGAPTVAWNGSLYLAVWNRSGAIYAQRIQQDGTKVDPNPISALSGFGPVDVAAVGDVFLVAGLRYGGNVQIIYPVGVRLRGSDGVILDGTPIILGENYTRSMGLASFGDRWMAVSFATWSHDESIGSTVGKFIQADGSTGVAFSIYGPYTMGGNGIIEVSAASDGTSALALQSVEVTSGVELDLVGVIVNGDGSLEPAVNLTPWSGNQYRPRVAWDGSQYIAVYNEQKNRFAPHTMDAIDATSDLFGMRISAAGVPIDPHGFAFSASTTAEAFPNITAAGGVALLSGSVVLNPAPYAAHRAGYELFGAGGNQPPVAVAAGNTSNGDVPLTVTFSSAGSSDPDGSLAGYLWDFGDGSSSAEPDPSHTYTAPGNYVATLTVTDDGGAQNVDTFAVAATAPNLLPIAEGSAEPPSGPPPLDVTLSASGSYDPDGSLGNFMWEFEDGSTYWGPTAYFTFNTNGVHPVILTVYDNRGAADSTTVYVYVGQPNQNPVAAASANPTTGGAPLDVDFSSAGSYDPDGDIVSYAWDFGDGDSSTLPNPAHTYQFPGLYLATLTVIDDDGATASASVEVQVDVAVYGLSLSADMAASGKPGETIQYALALTNTGNTPDTFLITTTVSAGQWETSAPASVGPLDPGESAALPVQVTIPAGVEDGEQSVATLTATSAGDPAVSDSAVLTTTAQVTYGVSLSPTMLEGSGVPGSTAAYTLTLTNSSDVPLSFTLSTEALWTVELSSASFSLQAGESAELVAAVTIPAGAAAGDQDSALIHAASVERPDLTAEATLVTSAQALYAVMLSPTSLQGSGLPGSSVAYTLTLTNTGNSALSFAISATGTWTVTLETALVDLEPGGSATLVASVHIPAGAMDGEQDTTTLLAQAVGHPEAAAQATLITTAVTNPPQELVHTFLPLIVRVQGTR